MLSVLAITFPFFALVLCGYLATRGGLLPLAAIPGLNAFVLFFALPCMLFRFGARTPIAELLDPAAAAVYLASGLALVAAAVALTRRRLGWNDAAFGALVVAFPNTGFMGVPLLVALLGPAAAGPVILTMLLDMVVTTAVCVGLSRLGDGGAPGAEGARAALGRALRGMAANPMPWSIALGALASALRLSLPGPLDRTVGLLADAAAPVALFAIGAVLARAGMARHPHEALGPRDGLGAALAKLVLHPLLVWALGRAAIAVGVPLSGPAHTALVLAAALPSASNVSLLAERFGAHTGRIARVILVSTALAFVSFSAAVALWS
ncbi:AEC family transporter [Acidovorax sp. NCPPB 2350]|nr:AEC family transporter [Acidovorax sp. NCPPB 2350]